MSQQSNKRPDGAHDSRAKWVLLGFLLVAGYFLWAEHEAHIVPWLPYALLLLCPLMHLFMHRGHGHGGHHGGQDHHADRRRRTEDDGEES